MRLLRTLVLLALASVLPLTAESRPVSYPGGWTVMQMNDGASHNLHMHYSPSIHYSLGYKAEYWPAGDISDRSWQFHGGQLNHLFKRWNRRASQANVYVKSAVGWVREQGGGSSLGGFTGIAADWENRRFFTAYENRFYHAGNIGRFYSQQGRIGIAPYLGDYGDLHTWLMLQVEHHRLLDNTHQDGNNSETTITPLIRLFKNEYLTEFGISTKGDALFNFVIRF